MGYSAENRTHSEPISNRVAKELTDMIFVQKLFSPGDKIPNERSLAIKLEVSRTSIREAIKILVANGVLEIHRGVGTFVSMTPGRKDDPFGFTYTTNQEKLFSDWCQARLLVEPEAMELVAENATEEELQTLFDLSNKEFGSIHESTNERANFLIGMDQTFHNVLAKATHNEVLSKSLPALQEWVNHGIALSKYQKVTKEIEEKIRKSHKRIVYFLQQRDAKGANLAMRYHIICFMEENEN